MIVHGLLMVAALALLLALLLALSAWAGRQRWGLASGATHALDNFTITSERFGLVGRPDRIIRRGRTYIPEEWKSSRRPQPWHQAQLGVYFVLIEERFGVRPPYGYLVCGRSRHRVRNTAQLRQWVLSVADHIRAARAAPDCPIRATVQPWQCRMCGQRHHCRQARA